MVFSDERLYDTDSADIFLNNIVHDIELLKHADEDRMCVAEYDDQAEQKHRCDTQKDQGHFRIQVETCTHSKDQHDRRSDRDTDHHLVRVLDVRYVRRQSRDDTAGLKLIDVRERERLQVVEHIMT